MNYITEKTEQEFIQKNIPYRVNDRAVLRDVEGNIHHVLADLEAGKKVARRKGLICCIQPWFSAIPDRSRQNEYHMEMAAAKDRRRNR